MAHQLSGPRGWVKGVVVGSESSEVAFEAVDDAFVAGCFGGPAAVVGIVAEGADVGELVGDGGDELGSSGVAGQVSQMLAYGQASATRSREQ